MSWRKWCWRGAIVGLVSALVVGLWLVRSYTRSSAIRKMVIEELQTQLQDVDVQLGAARFRLLGGISFSELRLIRKDDPTRTPFLIVPSGILLHDKEALQRGQLVIRKIELERPYLRIERRRDGQWNIDRLLADRAATDERPIPTFVCRGGHAAIIDLQHSTVPLVEIHEVEWTLVNDPLSTLAFYTQGQVRGLGPIEGHGRFQRWKETLSLQLESNDFQIEPATIESLIALVPEFADHIRQLSVRGRFQLDLVYRPDTQPRWQQQWEVDITDGKWEHAKLPLPLEGLQLHLSGRNGEWILSQATARAGKTRVNLHLEVDPPREDPHHAESTHPAGVAERSETTNIPFAPEDNHDLLPDDLGKRLRKIDVEILQLTLGPALFRRLPTHLQPLQRMFAPIGPVDVAYSFQRHPTGAWSKRSEVRPAGLTATYEEFAYPLERMEGRLVQTVTSDGTDRVDIDLTGYASGRPVTIKGKLDGPGHLPEIDLTIRGNELPIDEVLISALPDPFPTMVRQFHATGRGDFIATIQRAANTQALNKRFEITLQDCSIRHEQFPVSLSNIHGKLILSLLPPALGSREPVEMVELRNFRAARSGGRILLNGERRPCEKGHLITLHLQGYGLSIDAEWRDALKGIGLGEVWESLSPFGRTNVVTELKILDRSPGWTSPNFVCANGRASEAKRRNSDDQKFDFRRDLQLSMEFQGGGIEPSFFPYAMEEICLKFRFSGNYVDILYFTAKHHDTTIRFRQSYAILREEGGYYLKLNQFAVENLIPDGEFLAALPASIRQAMVAMKIHGRWRVQATELVIDEQPVVKERTLPTKLPPRIRGPHETNSQRVPVGRTTAVRNDTPTVVTVFWDGSLFLEGASIQTGVVWENVYGQIGCRGLYSGHQLGRVMGNIVLDRAVLAKQPLRNVVCKFEVDPEEPDILLIPSIQAKLYGGEVGGEARIVFGSPFRYDLNLNATGIQLEELVRHQRLGPDTQMQGLATAQLFLSSRTEGISREPILEGAGSIDVPNGRILNLPVLLDLLKVINLRAPDRTAFEEGHAQFKINGSRIEISQLDLLGNAICLGGDGILDLETNEIHFEFYTIWSWLMRELLKHWLATPIGEMTTAMSRNLFKIEVKGKLNGKIDYRKEAVPILFDPLKRVAERIQRRIDSRTQNLLGPYPTNR